MTSVKEVIIDYKVLKQSCGLFVAFEVCWFKPSAMVHLDTS